MISRPVILATCLQVLLMPRMAVGAPVLIDGFEASTSPLPWTFRNGGEYPGATGSLVAGPGHSGSGARLRFDFTNGGNYVAAELTLPSPLTMASIGLWVRSGNAGVGLRVTDSSGQVFQYSIARPPEARSLDDWFPVAISLGSSSVHWGGANDGTLHQPITNLMLMADRTGRPFPFIGSLEFDDVVALDDLATINSAATPVLEPFASPAVSSADPVGTLAERLGVAIHAADFPQNTTLGLDAARAAGFTWVRTDLFWSRVEKTQGVYDFSAWDTLANALAARGMKALFILDYANLLYLDVDCTTFANCVISGAPTDKCGPHTSASVEAFGNFAAAAAQHFSTTGVRFEVWNEPNIGFWCQGANSADYSTLAKEAIARVHDANPRAEISTGGLSSFDWSFLVGASPLGMLPSNVAYGTNAIGIHGYRGPEAESFARDVLWLRPLVAQYSNSPAPPIWDTEWGFSSTDFGGNGHDQNARLKQAQLVTRELLVNWVEGMPIAIYYDLRDDGTDQAYREHNFGLLAKDGTDKPAMVAARTLSTMAAGHALLGYYDSRIFPPGAGMHALKMESTQDVTAVIWSSAAGAEITLSLASTPASAVDFLGSPIALTVVQGKPAVIVSQATGPVYLKFPKPSAPVAVAGGPYAALVGQAVSFDGSLSSTFEGSVSCVWDFGDGEMGSGVTTSHVYSSAGGYLVTLTVTDERGMTDRDFAVASITAPPHAADAAPVAVVSGPHSGSVGEALTFSGSASSDADGSIVSYDWDFGDGSLVAGSTASHSFSSPGLYLVRLTVTDDHGAAAQSSTAVQVNANSGCMSMPGLDVGLVPLLFCLMALTRRRRQARSAS